MKNIIKISLILCFILIKNEIILCNENEIDSIPDVTGNLNFEYYYISIRHYNNFNENMTAISITYERLIYRYLTLEAGFCNYSYGNTSGISIPILVNLSSGTKNKIELGIGADLNLQGNFGMHPYDILLKLCYKYQPEKRGITIRFGGAFKYSDEMFFLGLGYSF